MGGETCAVDSPRSDCGKVNTIGVVYDMLDLIEYRGDKVLNNPLVCYLLHSKAMDEMELFHYTYLNSGYNLDVLASWTSDGCMDEVAARLGYRLVLKSGTFGSSAAPGGTIPYTIQIENVGYAAPVNTRQFQIVLRETSTDSLCAASDISEDVRTWYGGETTDVEGNLVLPADLSEGTYELFLNLADESPNLRTDPNFKVS